MASIDVKDARQWADVVARAHGVTPPSDVRFEQIAKEMGIKTEKVEKIERQRKDRIHIAERCYMQDLVKEYEGHSGFVPYIHILRIIGDEISFFHPTTN